MPQTPSQLIDWLQRLYQMETDLQALFSSQLDALASDSDFKSQVKDYLNSAKSRQQHLVKALDQFDKKPNQFKHALTKLLGELKGQLDSLGDDNPLTYLVYDLGYLQHALAFYRVTQLIAQSSDYSRITAILNKNLKAHKHLAQNLDQHFVDITQKELSSPS